MPTPPPPHPRSGFTLIEMAIVLVVIGLILGMVFKGRQLIDQGRVKKAAAQYYKIVGAIETFYDRYGFYPGDGCIYPGSSFSYTNPSSVDCKGPRRGFVQGNSAGAWNNDAKAFWALLIDGTGILSESDRESVFGQPWELISGMYLAGQPDETSWLDLPGQGRFDKRTVCALDQMIDDGHRSTGFVIDIHPGNYTPETDCWSLTGQGRIHIRVLP